MVQGLPISSERLGVCKGCGEPWIEKFTSWYGVIIEPTDVWIAKKASVDTWLQQNVSDFVELL